MFTGLGSESPRDDGGGFNLFSQDGVSDVSKQTTGATGRVICMHGATLEVRYRSLLVYYVVALCCSLPC